MSLLSKDKNNPNNTTALDREQVAALDRSSTPTRRLIRRFLRNRLAVVGVIILSTIVLSAVLAPLITNQDPYEVDLRQIRKPPSSEHWLGGDPSGRDIFARVIYGGRISLTIGLLSVILYVTAGTVLGLISGYYGGFVDTFLMRLTDSMMSIPSLLLILMLVTITKPSISSLIFAIALTRWPRITRLVRGQVLVVREVEYVTAARALGARPYAMMFRHILPNVLAPVIVAASFGVASAILSESAISFLGLGIPPPAPSWGQMLNQAQSITVLKTMSYYWIPPGMMIVFSVLSINFIGDGLRDALDPQSEY